jgi:hypothetical protein
MTGENLAATNENHEGDPKRRISRLDSNALIQGLERLRECFEQRLVRLEALARERVAQPAPVPFPDRTELELQLQQRIAEIEEAQLRLRTQAERREQEWRAALEQIEGDRALLAEAWEQLERERVEAPAAPASQAPRRAPAGTTERGLTTPVRSRPEPAEAANDHVAHTILQQFQALRNDVRRNARPRRSI